jgi:hypothetical protein
MMKIIAAVTTAALLVTAAAPADARGRHRHHHRYHDRVDGGDVVAGAILAVGIASIASSIKRHKRYRQDAAVEACAQEAEYRGGGRLTEVIHVARRNGYYNVDGALDSDRDGDGYDETFSCTVRNGRIYSLRLSRQEA